LIENPRFNSNLQRKKAEKIVASVLDFIEEILSSEGEVTVSGLDHVLCSSEARAGGRCLQVGEILTITARNIFTFKPSILLKQKLNGN
jgi:nucleoid DNA-binding protein